MSNIQTQLNNKAALASPTFTGTPKAPTAATGTSSTQIATTAFVSNSLSNLSISNYDVWSGGDWKKSDYRLNFTFSSKYKFYLVWVTQFTTSGKVFSVNSNAGIFSYSNVVGNSNGGQCTIALTTPKHTYFSEKTFTANVSSSGYISLGDNSATIHCVGFY